MLGSFSSVAVLQKMSMFNTRARIYARGVHSLCTGGAGDVNRQTGRQLPVICHSKQTPAPLLRNEGSAQQNPGKMVA